MLDFLSAINGAIDLISGSPLKLGNISFTDYAIPEKIAFGGQQLTSVKRLIGGQKIVESLGYAPTDPSWSGRFQGSSALSDARAVEAMTKAGLPVQLSYGGMLYKVIITSFQPIYERRYQIPYTITCSIIVLGDDDSDTPDQTLDDLIGADVLDSLGLGDLIGNVTLTDALSTAQAGLATVGKLTGNAAIGQIGNLVGNAGNIASSLSNISAGGMVHAALGIASGISSAGINAGRLTSVIGAANTLANSNAVSNLLSRASINLGR